MTNSKKDSELIRLLYAHSFAIEIHPKDFVLRINEKGVSDILQAINSKYITKEESDRRVLEARIDELQTLQAGILDSNHPIDDENHIITIYKGKCVECALLDRIAELRELLNGDKQ